MKKTVIIIALLVCCASSSYAQMEHFLPKYYEYAHGFNLDLFRFPIEKENYDVCAYMTFNTGYLDETLDIKTLVKHETIKFSGHLIRSSVDKAMVDKAIKYALSEAGIRSMNEFYDFVQNTRFKLHTLEYDEKQAWGEILGVVAVGFSAGALATEGGISTAASALSTAASTVGTAIGGPVSAEDVAVGSASILNSGIGQIASAQELDKLAGGSSFLGGVMDGVQLTKLIDKKYREVYDRSKNREYALDLGRIYGFYRYFNQALNNLAQISEAKNWLIVLDEKQLPSEAGFGGVIVSVNTNTSTALFKAKDPSDAKSKKRRTFEGTYSGYLKLSMVYDMSNFDANFVPNKEIFSLMEDKNIGEQYLEKNRLFTGADFNDFADGTRYKMGNLNPYGPMYKEEVKWDVNTPTTYSIDVDVPVTCEIKLGPGKSNKEVFAGLTTLSVGDYFKGFEEWGPVAKTVVKPEISINKSMQATLIPNADGSKASAAATAAVQKAYTKWVGAKIWSENGYVYEDAYEIDALEGVVGRSLAKFKNAKELQGQAFDEIINEKTLNLNLSVNLKSTVEPKYINKSDVDKEFANRMHEILESDYWNIKVK